MVTDNIPTLIVDSFQFSFESKNSSKPGGDFSFANV